MHTAHEQTSQPSFWGQRTGWNVLKQVLFLEPLPGGARWSAAFGSLLLFAFLLQVLTGILLAMSYAPSTEMVQATAPYIGPENEVQMDVPTAWASVNYIQEEVPLGCLIRALHHWGSSAMIILLLAHLIQVFVWGAYKKPRELTWMVGVLLLVCVLGLGFTGYLLPWDQKAYWATRVGLGIASTTPVIGDSLRTLLQGGTEIGNLTLTRFFTFHGFVLPLLLTVLVVVHLYLFRLHGVTPSWWQSDVELRTLQEPFWPKQALKDGILALLFLIGLGLWAFYEPAPLEAPANPAKLYEARPEWYFMFLFQLLRYFHGPYEVVGTFVLPIVFFLVIFFWPILDRNPHRDPRRRPVAIGLLGVVTTGLIGLTIFAIATDVRMAEPAQAVAQAPVAAEPAGPIQRADVAQIYNSHCVACHSVDGSGKQIRAGMPTIPDLTSLAWQMSQTDLEIMHRIQDGTEPLMPAYRDKLAQQQILALTVYVRAFAIGPLEPGAPRLPQPAPVPVAAQMPPAQVYRAYCLACHDTDGRGQIVRKAMPETPDLTDPKWQAARSDAELKQSILSGKGKFMLPMNDKLSPADAEQMVAYVRAFRGAKQVVPVEPQPPVVPPAPAQPAVVLPPKAAPTALPPPTPAREDTAARMRVATGLYRQFCLVCHGADGRGTEMKASMPTLPDLTGRAWQDVVSNPQIAVSILDGKGTLMPAFQGRIDDGQTQDLVAYVRAFGPEGVTPAAPAASDYDKRFSDLQKQLEEIRKQMETSDKQPQKKTDKPGPPSPR